jgi:hypothetical protein
MSEDGGCLERVEDLCRLADEISGRLEEALARRLAEVEARASRLEELIRTVETAGIQAIEDLAAARKCLEGLRAVAAALERGKAAEVVPEVREEDLPVLEPPVEEAEPGHPTAEVQESAGRLSETAPAQPVAEPTKRKGFTRKKLSELTAQWFEETRPIPDQKMPDLSTILRWKRLVCTGRMLLVGFEECDQDADAVAAELQVLSKAFEALGERGNYFAFNRHRNHTFGTWDVLSRALAASEAALRSATLLRDHADLFKQNERSDLCSNAVAASLWAKEMLSKRAEVSDADVNEAARVVASVAEEVMEGGGTELARANPSSRIAKKVIDDLHSWEKTIEQRKAKRDAENLLASAPDGELVDAIRKAREMGLPASNTTLLERAKEVKDRLSPESDAEVLKFLEKREAKSSGAKAASTDTMKPLDPEYVRKLGPVHDYCSGKVLFILGGKTKNRHADQYREVLGFSEVIWPDTEKSTKPSSLEPLALKGDVVVYNPKFARHAYKRVVDRATQAGKCVITLDHGYGVEQLVHCIYEQLARRGYIA